MVDDNGKVIYSIELDFYVDTLYVMVQHNFTLDDSILFFCFREAIVKAFLEDSLKDHKNILNLFKKLCYEKLKVKNKYFLLTSINLRKSCIPKNKVIKGCKISFYSQIPLKYQKARAELINHPANRNSLIENGMYIYVVVSVTSPDPETDFKYSLEALDIYRALFGLCITKQLKFRTEHHRVSHQVTPNLSLGQVHTLHLPNGKKRLATCFTKTIIE